jgi:single-stranded-DNA-specific exonuclease
MGGSIKSKRWKIAPKIPPQAASLLQDYPPVLRQILYNRGHSTPEKAHKYLNPHLIPDIDANLMLGIPAAVDRISRALAHSERIAIYGDYDADGVTATALLVQTLQALDGDVLGYIPNRFDEGYGLNRDALDNLYAQGIRLVITVDCGIRSLPEVEHARSLGLDLIISDHHHPAQELPAAFSIINPKQLDDPYPDKDLAGVGLAYKLAAALTSAVPPKNSFDPEFLLDLVALGTVADLAPLTGENRALVRRGLEYIRLPHRQGIMALMGVSGINPNQINASHIGFGLGPRLNAAGRLESALDALKLLMTTDVAEAGRLAQQLEIQNRERQQITKQIQEAAEKLALEDNPDPLLLFAAHRDFNPGVVGLAASRLSELYYRPAVVAHLGESYTRASCRSIPEFHITQALDQCADLLEHHGGHAAAAGFTVRNENLPTLIAQLEQIAAEKLGETDLRQTLNADLEIRLAELRPEILTYLEWLQPTGYGNPQAYFVTRGVKPSGLRAVGRDGAHLRLSVSDGWITYDAIAFQQGYWINQIPSRIDVLYNFELNEWNGRQSLQLNIRDLKPSGHAD